MIITASITMYSGMSDPEMYLSNEQAQKICEKLNKAYDKSDEKLKDHKLGFRGYMILWHGGDGKPYTCVRVHEGIISIRSFNGTSYLKDTIGLEAHMKELLAETLKSHLAGFQ